MSPTNSSEFVDEVLRINQRYLTEVVEGFDVCPFARGARLAGAVKRRVLLDETADPASALAVISELEADQQTSVALLIYPCLAVPPEAFDRLLNAIREADLERRAEGSAPFAMAAFHPDGHFGSDSPRKMVMFFRHSPDPTVQLVRFSTLDAVKGDPTAGGKFLFDWSADGWAELARREKTQSVSDRIAEHNFDTARKEGVSRFEALFADIRADRDRAYARFTSQSKRGDS